MARQGTKRQNAIELMMANPDPTGSRFAEIVGKIAERNGDSIAVARSYYNWIAENIEGVEAVSQRGRRTSVASTKTATATVSATDAEALRAALAALEAGKAEQRPSEATTEVATTVDAREAELEARIQTLVDEQMAEQQATEDEELEKATRPDPAPVAPAASA